MTETTYQPGAWHAVVADRYAVLVENTVGRARLDAVRQAMSDDEGFEAVLDALSGGRLAGLPAFAVAGTGPEGVRVVTRPGVQVIVNGDRPGERAVTCDGWRTWADVLLEPGVEIRMVREGTIPADDVYPFLGGMVLADRLTWVTSAPAAAHPADPSALARRVEPPLPPAEPPPPPVETPTPPEPVGAGDANSYDELWGMTRHRSIEEAAVRAEDDEDAEAAEEIPALLDVIPGLSPSSSTSAPIGPNAALPPLAPLTSASGPADTIMGLRPATIRPQVLAIACSAGHPNPPSSPRCRECGVDVSYADPAPMARPRLGVLRFSTGQTVGLDQSVLIGRNPTADRVDGDRLPTMVPLDGVGRDISRTHAEVRLDDWNVLLVDLGSRNGTFARLPERPEQRLGAHTPFHLLPGTVVRLADDASFVFEVR